MVFCHSNKKGTTQSASLASGFLSIPLASRAHTCYRKFSFVFCTETLALGLFFTNLFLPRSQSNVTSAEHLNSYRGLSPVTPSYYIVRASSDIILLYIFYWYTFIYITWFSFGILIWLQYSVHSVYQRDCILVDVAWRSHCCSRKNLENAWTDVMLLL